MAAKTGRWLERRIAGKYEAAGQRNAVLGLPPVELAGDDGADQRGAGSG